jgi:integrase
MRGHLEDRGKNVWRAKVYVGRQADGRRLYMAKTIHGNKRFAEDRLAEMLLEVGPSEHAASDGTLAELVERWRPIAELNLSPTTLREYERLLEKRILPRFGGTKVRAIRAADIDAYYADLQRQGRATGGALSAQSIHHIHALLRRLLNQAVRWGLIASNPVARATPPRVPRHELTIPEPEQVGRIIAQTEKKDSDLACFLRMAVITGARRGELCALRWTDIDMKTATLTIARSVAGPRNDELIEKGTKTHASRRISLDQASVESLQQQRRRCEDRALAAATTYPSKAFVFSDSVDGDTPWHPNRVTHAFGRICETAGVFDVRLHDLRHFAATRLLAAGVPVNTVAGRLGHANPTTTLNVYAHFLESADESAAQVLGSLLDTASQRQKGSPMV